ncbi:MAG: M48 family metallopeptidase [Alphaproteobacteria bacterium]|nr:M48 family metallopeptidase [Alphaproteobacteria bacterium]
MHVDGRYFFPHSARFVTARATLEDDGVLKITGEDNAPLAEVRIRAVQVSSRLANIARRLTLPDGACFETYDNDGVDDLLREARRFGADSWVDRLERSWKSVVVSVALAGLAGYAFVAFGIPAIAAKLAQDTPPAVSQLLAEQTMAALDRTYLKPSTLSAADRAKAEALFKRVAANEPRGPGGYHLVFRDGGVLAANAFALPDGRVVMTDELWHLVRNDEEIEGVFAHEMSHVNHAHGLTRVYEASLVPAAIAVVTGDLSQVSQLAVILPGILAQSAYSREFEQQADDDAAATMMRIGARPARLAAFLERLEAKTCGKGGCGPSWLGSHPRTAIRADRLRAEDSKK